MDDRPIDLGPLDPDEDPWRRQRVVGGAMAHIRTLQREPASAWAGWLRWWRPAVAFAGVVMAASIAALASAPGGGGAAPGVTVSGVPAPVAEWMASDRLPSAAEVYATVQGYR